MLRKRIGGWLLVLGSLVAPATAPAAVRAQDLQKWCASPMEWAAPAAPDPAPGGQRAAPWAAPPQPPPGSLLPFIARGQDVGEEYYVPPVPFTGPLSHPRYEDGGPYVGAEFLYFKQSRPILSQSVAFRGFMDTNGGVTGAPGTFVGSHEEALNTNMVQGQGSYQPGTNIFVGWRFKNGVSVELDWWHLTESRYSAQAGVISPNFNVGNTLENTFLFSPVTNFPIFYGGNPASVIVNGVPATGSTFGIWNAASEMSIQFIQRFELVQVNARIPVWETDTYRAYGTFGPRAIVMWEEFWWHTVQRDVLGAATNDTSAQYTNVTSNRLYGAYVGSGHDWYLGNTPIGAFAVDLNVNAGLYLDFVKGRAGYELGDKSNVAHRSLNTYSVVPGLDGKLGLMWYPWEAIQVRLGYNFMALFNTYASPRPIDFNFGTINPEYSNGISRLIQGIDLGIAFVF
jgi:hypothetical protein